MVSDAHGGNKQSDFYARHLAELGWIDDATYFAEERRFEANRQKRLVAYEREQAKRDAASEQGKREYQILEEQSLEYLALRLRELRWNSRHLIGRKMELGSDFDWWYSPGWISQDAPPMNFGDAKPAEIREYLTRYATTQMQSIADDLRKRELKRRILEENSDDELNYQFEASQYLESQKIQKYQFRELAGGEAIVSEWVQLPHKTIRFSGGRWYRWDDETRCYRNIGKEEIEAKLLLFLNRRFKNPSVANRNSVIENLKSLTILPANVVDDSPCWVSGETLDHRDIVVTTQGIIHLPKLTSYSHDWLTETNPSFFTTHAVDVEYDPASLCGPPSLTGDDEWVGKPPTEWFRFLESAFPGDEESKQLLQEWFGYCLTPDTSQEKMLTAIGPPRSGKGTVAKVLKMLIGEQNCSGASLSQLQQQFGLQPLLGKTLNVIADARIPKGKDLSIMTERLLNITGRDDVTVDVKHSPQVCTKLLTRIMILSNELPQIPDTSGALASRMLVLRFNESFLGREDTELLAKLEAEKSRIFHWSIAGWKRLRDRGYFIQPAASESTVETLQNITSPMKSFLRETVKLDPGKFVEVDTLYGRWEMWCSDTRERPTSKVQFGRDLNAIYPRVEAKQKRISPTSRPRCYIGIRLRRDDEEQDP